MHHKRHPVFHALQLRAAQNIPYSTRAPVFVGAKQDEHFEVSDILAHRDSRRGRTYLVAGAGYDAHDNTWEPEGNLEGAH